MLVLSSFLRLEGSILIRLLSSSAGFSSASSVNLLLFTPVLNAIRSFHGPPTTDGVGVRAIEYAGVVFNVGYCDWGSKLVKVEGGGS